jgi:hypothetical protein
MRHNWCYKKIGDIPTDLYMEFQQAVVNLNYTSAADLDYSVSINTNQTLEFITALAKFANFMTKFFRFEGLRATNIARMNPMSYLREHTDGKNTNHLPGYHDQLVKMQIPIITSDKSGMMWPPEMGMPATLVNFQPGGIYIIDNLRYHSAVNLNNSYRYYLTSRWHVDSLIDRSLLD